MILKVVCFNWWSRKLFVSTNDPESDWFQLMIMKLVCFNWWSWKWFVSTNDPESGFVSIMISKVVFFSTNDPESVLFELMTLKVSPKNAKSGFVLGWREWWRTDGKLRIKVLLISIFRSQVYEIWKFISTQEWG